MNGNALKNLPHHFRKRQLAILVSLLAGQGVSAGTLTVHLSDVKVESGSIYNSGAAVCNANKGNNLSVSAKFTADFTPDSTSATQFSKCTKFGNPAQYYYQTGSYSETKSTNQSITVSAQDSKGNFSTNLTGGPVFNGALQPIQAPDNKYGVEVTADASELVTVQPYSFERQYGNTDSSCQGAYTDTPPTTAGGKVSPTTNTGSATDKTSAYYYVDLQSPIVTHTVENPDLTEPSDGTPDVMQNTCLNLNIKSKYGSSEQPFTVQPGFGDPIPDGTWGVKYNGDFSKSLNDGIDTVGQTHGACVTVSCSVPVGAGYESWSKISSAKDLCGNDFVDPDPITASKSPIFDVIENPECLTGSNNNIVITAPLPPASNSTDPSSSEESYALIHCFTSQNAGKGKTKVASYPGTQHVGTVLTTPEGSGESCDEGGYIALGDVTFYLNDGDDNNDFIFYQTGKSPEAHLFVGLADGSAGWADPPLDPPGPDIGGPGFYYHTGWPLVEQDIKDKITVSGNTLTIDLSNYDFGCGENGYLQKGKTIYARAHAKFTGIPYVPTAPDEGEKHTFTTSVNVDGTDIESTGNLGENPVDDSGASICIEGQIVTPTPP